jgi:hypothetical protein
MDTDKREFVLERVTRRMAGSPNARARLAAKAREIKEIASSNYGAAVRRCLSRQELKEIVSWASRVWPTLNHKPVRLVSLDEFVRRWSVFGVEIKFAHFSSKSGLWLLGFYLPETHGVSRKPLIVVNTAHHPALVGLALDHEMGHHLTSRLLVSGKDRTHFLSFTGFKEHLTEPVELAADILVSFAIFPLPVARTVYDQGVVAKRGFSNECFAKVLGYIASRYGFRFELLRDADKRFQALAALVHYTKLRRALMDEYRT